jgi:hypothetical protein
MNKKWLPHGITAGALVVFIVLGLACASSPSPEWTNVSYTGEETPLLEGTTWNLTYSDGDANRTVVFQSSGKLFISGISGSSTWQRIGNNVKFITGDGFASYEGTYDQGKQTIMGFLQYSGGKSTNFGMVPVH